MAGELTGRLTRCRREAVTTLFRSLRIRGVVTTLRLENQFWDILREIAEVDGMTTNQLITKLYEEVMDYRGEVVNFASFLRVSCTRFLAQRPQQSAEVLSLVQSR